MKQKHVEDEQDENLNCSYNSNAYEYYEVNCSEVQPEQQGTLESYNLIETEYGRY
jgi:hypothetical protein